MGYIGNQTSNSYTSLAKQTITGDGGASYTLDHAVANVNEIEVFVNNVRQEPSVAYTVSGTALTMTGNVESSDDFYVVFQGKAIQTVVPPDDSVTTARINDDAVTNAKIADNAVDTAQIADDAVTTAKMDDNDRMVDTWYLTSDTGALGGSGQLIGSDDSMDLTNKTDIGYVGTSRMSESAGIFTFPKTGVYKISAFLTIKADAADDVVRISIDQKKGGGSYTISAYGYGFHRAGSNQITCHAQLIFDCEATSTDKVRFVARSATGCVLLGGDDPMSSYFIFERIADTQ